MKNIEIDGNARERSRRARYTLDHIHCSSQVFGRAQRRSSMEYFMRSFVLGRVQYRTLRVDWYTEAVKGMKQCAR